MNFLNRKDCRGNFVESGENDAFREIGGSSLQLNSSSVQDGRQIKLQETTRFSGFENLAKLGKITD